jgi:hypothetical protein
MKARIHLDGDENFWTWFWTWSLTWSKEHTGVLNSKLRRIFVTCTRNKVVTGVIIPRRMRWAVCVARTVKAGIQFKSEKRVWSKDGYFEEYNKSPGLIKGEFTDQLRDCLIPSTGTLEVHSRSLPVCECIRSNRRSYWRQLALQWARASF